MQIGFAAREIGFAPREIGFAAWEIGFATWEIGFIAWEIEFPAMEIEFPRVQKPFPLMRIAFASRILQQIWQKNDFHLPGTAALPPPRSGATRSGQNGEQNIMSFDPTWPPTGADLESARCRNQFNALNDQNTATNQRIDNIQLIPGPQGPQGIPGNDGAQGPQGPQGEPGPNAFPHTGDAEINGNIKNNGMTYTGGVGIGVSDAGGSGESGVLHGTDSAAGMQIPVVAIRSGGSTAFQIRLDYGGQIDGNGTPTIQNGDLFGYDGMAGCLKPVRGVTQDVTISDGNGGFITLHIQSGLITSITGP